VKGRLTSVEESVSGLDGVVDNAEEGKQEDIAVRRRAQGKREGRR
jgi:hypothetical protein